MIEYKHNKKILKYMAKLRKKMCLSRGAVVKTTGLSLNTVKNTENIKHTGGMQVKTVKLLCACYGTTLAKLFKKLKM